MATLRILDSSGDTKLEWSPTDTASVEEVRRRFDELIDNGYYAYAFATPDTERPTMTRSFNPDAHEIITAPRLVGG